jgi:hypothetical protein
VTISGTGISGGGSIDTNRTLSVGPSIAYRRPFIVENTTSRNLQLSDLNSVILCTSVSTTTITIPAESSVNFAVGTTIDIIRGDSAGTVNITSSAGVNINGVESLVYGIDTQLNRVMIIKFSSDDWDLIKLP